MKDDILRLIGALMIVVAAGALCWVMLRGIWPGLVFLFRLAF